MTNSKSNRCRKSISSSERKLWNGGLQQETNDSSYSNQNGTRTSEGLRVGSFSGNVGTRTSEGLRVGSFSGNVGKPSARGQLVQSVQGMLRGRLVQ